MKISVEWSDLIIEEGKLDPLGLWRVSDRLGYLGGIPKIRQRQENFTRRLLVKD